MTAATFQFTKLQKSCAVFCVAVKKDFLNSSHPFSPHFGSVRRCQNNFWFVSPTIVRWHFSVFDLLENVFLYTSQARVINFSLKL